MEIGQLQMSGVGICLDLNPVLLLAFKNEEQFLLPINGVGVCCSEKMKGGQTMSVQQIPPPPPPFCTGFYYTVVPGDSLFTIANRFGVPLSALVAANPQITNPNLIFPGQVICIPGAQIPTIECSMLLFRTANVPVLPEAEAAGVARVFQAPNRNGNVLVAAIGLPPPTALGGNIYVAWIRRQGAAPIPFQLLQTGPVVIQPGVWIGAITFVPGEQFAPFQDIVVTAEIGFPVTNPNLNRIALIGNFTQCRPQ